MQQLNAALKETQKVLCKLALMNKYVALKYF